VESDKWYIYIADIFYHQSRISGEISYAGKKMANKFRAPKHSRLGSILVFASILLAVVAVFM